MSDNKSSEDNLERIYNFIHDYLQQHNGLSPSIREIAKGCYMAHSNLIRYLDKLEFQNRIEREAGIPRSIRLLHDDKKLD